MGKDEQGRLSPDELKAIKDQLLESIYADIGKSVVRKILWVGGAVILALFAWMRVHGLDGDTRA